MKWIELCIGTWYCLVASEIYLRASFFIPSAALLFSYIQLCYIAWGHAFMNPSHVSAALSACNYPRVCSLCSSSWVSSCLPFFAHVQFSRAVLCWILFQCCQSSRITGQYFWWLCFYHCCSVVLRGRLMKQTLKPYILWIIRNFQTTQTLFMVQ